MNPNYDVFRDAPEGMKGPEIYLERTIAIIKPDAIHKAEEIEDIILKNGFNIITKRQVHLTPEEASEFYAEHYGKMFFPSLLAYMSSGPIIVMQLGRKDAICHWRNLIGPTNSMEAKEESPESVRARYGTDDQRNAVHGSADEVAAAREIRFFFRDDIVEPVMRGQAARDYLAQSVNATLQKGLTELCKMKPDDPVTWLADWLLDNNPYKPEVKREKKPRLDLDDSKPFLQQNCF